DHVSVLREPQHRVTIVETTFEEARGDAGAGTIGIGIQHVHFRIVTQGVLQEHATQLAAPQQRYPRAHRGPKIAGYPRSLVASAQPAVPELYEAIARGELDRAVGGELDIVVRQHGRHAGVVAQRKVEAAQRADAEAYVETIVEGLVVGG